MLGTEFNKISFNDILRLPFSKTTLPAKIINLRKVSQENHVRRMKFAHQKKQIQAPSDASMNLSTSAPRKNLSSFQTPFTMLNTRLDIENINSYDKNLRSPSSCNRNNFSPKVLVSCNRKRDCHSKFTDLKKTENSSEFINRNVKSDTTVAYRENISGKYPSNIKAITPNRFAKKNEYRYKIEVNDSGIPKTKLNNATSRFSEKNNYLKTQDRQSLIERGDEKISKDYVDINGCFKDKSSSERKTKLRRASKIPVSLTRLPYKEQNNSTQTLSYKFEKSPPKSKAFSPKFQTDFVQDSDEKGNEIDILKSQKKFLNTKIEDRSFNDVLIGCFPKDLKYNYLKKACEHNCEIDSSSRVDKLLSNSKSLTSSWFDDILHDEETNKNVTSSLHAAQEDSSTANRKTPQKGLREKHLVTPKVIGFKSSSEQTDSQGESLSGTDQSLEYYYDTETGNDTVTQDEDKGEWREDSDDEDFTVTVQTRKSMGKDAANKSVSQSYANNPDYPKTPYDLRYPRYKSGDTDSKKMYAETRLRTPKSKNRKKISKSTPKRKRGSKPKRNLNFKKQDGLT